MRQFFSVALTVAICSAEDNVAQQSDAIHDYGPYSPLMQTHHEAHVLDVMAHPHYYPPPQYVHDTGVAPHAHFTAPVFTAQGGPIHAMAADTFHHELMHEFDPELHDPLHVFHSAEQPPPLVPHAFDDRYERAGQVGMYYPLPKYHAHGSHHAHEDLDVYGPLLDPMRVPVEIRDIFGRSKVEPEKPQPSSSAKKDDKQKKPHQGENFMSHVVGDDHHDVEISASNIEPPADFYLDPYHGDDLETHHHEALVEDMNPNDHDIHHGPQLHAYDLPEHAAKSMGMEHHDILHHQEISYGLPQVTDSELFHGHQVHHDMGPGPHDVHMMQHHSRFY